MCGHEHKDHYNGLEKALSEPMTDAEARAILKEVKNNEADRSD